MFGFGEDNTTKSNTAWESFKSMAPVTMGLFGLVGIVVGGASGIGILGSVIGGIIAIIGGGIAAAVLTGNPGGLVEHVMDTGGKAANLIESGQEGGIIKTAGKGAQQAVENWIAPGAGIAAGVGTAGALTNTFRSGGSGNALKQADGIIRRCLLYTSPSPRDQRGSRMPSSA